MAPRGGFRPAPRTSAPCRPGQGAESDRDALETVSNEVADVVKTSVWSVLREEPGRGRPIVVMSLSALVPQYALDALDALESHQLTVVEDHLETCGVCRLELDVARRIAAALVPDAPAPASAWDRIGEQIDGFDSRHDEEAQVVTLDPTRDQLWVTNDGGVVISAGVLAHRPKPATFTWTGSVSGFALTREVAGGVTASEGDVVSVITDV